MFCLFWTDLVSVWMSLGIPWKKIVIHLNSVGYPSQKNVIRLNGLGCPFGKNCHLFERLGISVSKNCYPFGRLGLSVWKRNCRPLEELNLRQRQILAKFPSQNHFISTHSCRTICYSPGPVCYEVCLQTYHEYLWVSAPFVAIFAFIL